MAAICSIVFGGLLVSATIPMRGLGAMGEFARALVGRFNISAENVHELGIATGISVLMFGMATIGLAIYDHRR